MIYAAKQFLRRTAGWVIGQLKRNTWNWAKQLYVVAIVLYSGWIIWRVASGTVFLPQSDQPTSIQLDLLQVMAFLVAWTALIVTITAKVVGTSKDFEAKIAQTSRDIENDASRWNQFFSKTEGKLKKVEEELLPRMNALERENQQLREQLGDDVATCD